MFKSVFSKYFTLMACLLGVAMLVLGCVQLFFFNNYWIDEKRTQLCENASHISQHTAGNIVKGDKANSFRIRDVRSVSVTVNMVAKAIDADVMIVNTAGELLIGSDDIYGRVSSVPMTLLDEVGWDYFTVGDMNGRFSSQQYIAATPIMAQTDVCVGYAIVAASADNLFEYTKDTLYTYLMSALSVMFVFTIIIYIVTYRMVKPLREMAAATKAFAEGDFSYRIKVKGRDEIAVLTTALNSMADSLATTESMSRSFVANISHELKTPMTTISGFVDGILDGTIPPDRQEHYLRIVSDEVRRLSRLVKAMLELSRIDNGSVALKPVTFDLTDTALSALLSFEQRIDEKHIEIDGISECERVLVNADRDLIGQVVYNLLDNAVKFVDVGGTITVRVFRADGRVYCTIKNSGAGLSAEEMPRVFERFYKTDRSRGLDKTGVGLGLYIVKSVINLHNGEITVRSVEGDYCEFVFWLPEETAAAKTDKS